MMKITGLSHLFKWDNLHNWWLTKYFFAPLYISVVSFILLCRSSQELSGWMGSVAAQLFSGLSRDVRSVSSPVARPLKDNQRLAPKPLLRCLGCVLRVVVLLEGAPLCQTEILSPLEQVFIKELSVPFSVYLSLYPD
jgi:hypothetical protein